jgi:hypothetical protein
MIFSEHADEMTETHGQGEGYMLVDGRRICSIKVPRVKAERMAQIHEAIANAVE